MKLGNSGASLLPEHFQYRRGCRQRKAEKLGKQTTLNINRIFFAGL